MTSKFEHAYSEFNNNELPSEEIFVRSEEIPSEEVTIKFEENTEKSIEKREVIEDKSEINREDSIDKEDEELSDINNTTCSKDYEQEFSGLLDEMLTEKDTRFGLTHSLLEGSLIDDSRISTASDITTEPSEDIADRKTLKIAINVTNEITDDETVQSVKPNISFALDNMKAVDEPEEHNEEIEPVEQEESSIKENSDIQNHKPIFDDDIGDLNLDKKLAKEFERLSRLVSGDSSELGLDGDEFEEDDAEEENLEDFYAKFDDGNQNNNEENEGEIQEGGDSLDRRFQGASINL